MNAPILAASFLLGSLNPKFGLAPNSGKAKSADDNPQAPRSTLVSQSGSNNASQSSDVTGADRVKENKKGAENKLAAKKANGEKEGKSGKSKIPPSQSATVKSAATASNQNNNGGLLRKSRRLDPDRQGFSALIPASSKVMTVRVTVYWKNGKGTDYYSSQGISATGNRLINKRSAAVDPSLIPYGSKIILPEAGKELVAVDTGSAVVKRTAAKKLGKDVPVIDIFFDCKKEALDFASNYPAFMKAVVVAN